jgi:hypothetical protein
MASGMTPTKRFAVRLSLVTSSTVAMIIGAQSLATLDAVNAAPTDSANTAVVQTTSIVQAAPSITILRHAATTAQAAPSVSISPRSNGGQSAAQPPAQLAAPARSVMQPPVPVVVSGSSMSMPSVPVTRSSR